MTKFNYNLSEAPLYMSDTSRYTKYKLSGSDICVIKKALEQYKTKELENERLEILNRIIHVDTFMCLYTAKRVRKDTTSKKKSSAVKQLTLTDITSQS